MYLIQSWVDSLSLFKPKNFKLFGLITAKSIGVAYGLLLKYFWWIPFGMICVSSYFDHQYIWRIACFIWLFVAVFCARPSVSKKNCAYFRRYGPHVPSFVAGLFTVLIFFVVCQLVLLWILSFLNLESAYFLILILSYGMALAVSSVITLFCFSVSDMPVSLKNCAKALRFTFMMVWYNAPAVVLLYAPLIFVTGLISIRLSEASRIVEWMMIPVQVCVLGNFYIKRLHEQSKLFFKQPKDS